MHKDPIKSREKSMNYYTQTALEKTFNCGYTMVYCFLAIFVK
jgi:hypothetical protein